MSIEEEADRLRRELEQDDLTPAVLRQVIGDATPQARDELVRRVAHTFAPAPGGGLLSRLVLLRSDSNAAELTAAFLANLGSRDAGARTASLYGLDTLDYPAVADAAIAALRDRDGRVVASACEILLRRRAATGPVRTLLEGLLNTRRDDPEFYLARELLVANGIGDGPPAAAPGVGEEA